MVSPGGLPQGTVGSIGTVQLPFLQMRDANGWCHAAPSRKKCVYPLSITPLVGPAAHALAIAKRAEQNGDMGHLRAVQS
eukprot:4581779-Amphidinium_carterae.1